MWSRHCIQPRLLFFPRPSLVLLSPDLPLVSPGTATIAANGQGLYLHTGTERERARDIEEHRYKREGESHAETGVETGGGGTKSYGGAEKRVKSSVMLPM